MLVLGVLPILGVLMNGEIQSQRADVHIKLSNPPRATLPDPRFDLLFLQLSTAIFSAVVGWCLVSQVDLRVYMTDISAQTGSNDRWYMYHDLVRSTGALKQ